MKKVRNFLEALTLDQLPRAAPLVSGKNAQVHQAVGQRLAAVRQVSLQGVIGDVHKLRPQEGGALQHGSVTVGQDTGVHGPEQGIGQILVGSGAVSHGAEHEFRVLIGVDSPGGLEGRGCVAIRMGGDEFVIFAKLKSDEEALALKKQIKYNVRQFNIKSKEPFHLSFSIGIAKYSGNIDTFLSAMDDSMYEAKKMHRLMH